MASLLELWVLRHWRFQEDIEQPSLWDCIKSSAWSRGFDYKTNLSFDVLKDHLIAFDPPLIFIHVFIFTALFHPNNVQNPRSYYWSHSSSHSHLTSKSDQSLAAKESKQFYLPSWIWGTFRKILVGGMTRSSRLLWGQQGICSSDLCRRQPF